MSSAIHPMNDIYDEEFLRYLHMAKILMEKLHNPLDRGIVMKWIGRLKCLKSKDPSVKKNRNCFFKYMLEILQKGVEVPPEGIGFPQIDDKGRSFSSSSKKQEAFMCRWSGDKRVYVAAKPIPGQGALVYMAVSSDISLGWDVPPAKTTTF